MWFDVFSIGPDGSIDYEAMARTYDTALIKARRAYRLTGDPVWIVEHHCRRADASCDCISYATDHYPVFGSPYDDIG